MVPQPRARRYLRPRCGHGAALTGPARPRARPDPIRPAPAPAGRRLFLPRPPRPAPPRSGSHRRKEAERGPASRVSQTRASGGPAGEVRPDSRHPPAPHPVRPRSDFLIPALTARLDRRRRLTVAERRMGSARWGKGTSGLSTGRSAGGPRLPARAVLSPPSLRRAGTRRGGELAQTYFIPISPSSAGGSGLEG